MTIFSATIRNNVVILFCESSGRSATIFFSASLHALKIVVAYQCQERDVTTIFSATRRYIASDCYNIFSKLLPLNSSLQVVTCHVAFRSNEEAHSEQR